MSATGTEARRGFSLVELMVVLVLVGLLGSAVVMAVPDGRPRVANEAETFAARLTLARDEAVLSNRTVEAVVDADGYRFRLVRAGGREPMETPPFAPAEWHDDLSVAPAGPLILSFDPTGLATPSEVTLTREEETARIRIDGAGAVTVHAG